MDESSVCYLKSQTPFISEQATGHRVRRAGTRYTHTPYYSTLSVISQSWTIRACLTHPAWHPSFVCTHPIGCAAVRRTLQTLVLLAVWSRLLWLGAWESTMVHRPGIKSYRASVHAASPLITSLDPTWKVQYTQYRDLVQLFPLGSSRYFFPACSLSCLRVSAYQPV